MQRMLKKPQFNLNHKVWARPKRTIWGLSNWLDLWLTRNWWSTELDWSQLSITNALWTSLRKRMFNQGSTSIESFQNYQQHLGLQGRLAAMTRFLVQLTAITDQKWSGYTRIPHNTAFLQLRLLFPMDQLPRVGSSTLRDYGDSGPDSIPDSP
jgi:hypothetical protein